MFLTGHKETDKIMRALETKEVRAKKESGKKRNHTIAGIVISVIMLFSIVGYAFLSGQGTEEDSGTREYNGYLFIETESGFQTQVTIQNTGIALTSLYFPEELENISTNTGLLLSDFNNKIVYIVTNTSTQIPAYKLSQSLNSIALRIQAACSEQEAETEFCIERNLPIKTCEDADFQNSIIILKETEPGTETKINYELSCLTLEGSKDELIKASEKVIFMIYGIM